MFPAIGVVHMFVDNSKEGWCVTLQSATSEEVKSDSLETLTGLSDLSLSPRTSQHEPICPKAPGFS